MCYSPSPPLAGERAGVRWLLFNRSINRFNNRLGLLQHLSIPESQHCPTLRVQVCCSCWIQLCVLRMLPAISFNYNLFLNAGKIGNIGADSVLSPEFEAVHTTVAQMPPEQLLGIGHALPERSCIINSQRPPHPDLFPLSGGEGTLILAPGLMLKVTGLVERSGIKSRETSELDYSYGKIKERSLNISRFWRILFARVAMRECS